MTRIEKLIKAFGIEQELARNSVLDTIGLPGLVEELKVAACMAAGQMSEDDIGRAHVIAQSLAEVQAEVKRFRAESEGWPAFDGRHAMLKTFEAAAGDPVEGDSNE